MGYGDTNGRYFVPVCFIGSGAWYICVMGDDKMTLVYDSRNDLLKHKKLVEFWLNDFSVMLSGRGRTHDRSKFQEPEKSIYDKFIPLLRDLEFGSEEYNKALVKMGDGLKHHYAENSHHPEHYRDGIDGMNLYDLVEMFCDWLAVAEDRRQSVNLPVLAERFGMSSQLVNIFRNTLDKIDFDMVCQGAFKPEFSPKELKETVA